HMTQLQFLSALGRHQVVMHQLGLLENRQQFFGVWCVLITLVKPVEGIESGVGGTDVLHGTGIGSTGVRDNCTGVLLPHSEKRTKKTDHLDRIRLRCWVSISTCSFSESFISSNTLSMCWI